MAPDDPEEILEQGPKDEAEGSGEPDQAEEARPGEESAPAQAPKPGQEAAAKAGRKVDLDLDDAPFLEDEEEQEVALEEPPEEREVLKDRGVKKPLPAFLKKKSFYLGGAVGLLIALIAFFAIPRGAIPPPPPPAEPEKPAAPIEVKKGGETLVRLDPFWIEQRDEENNIRFLVARLNFSTDNEQLAKNFVQETITVRNALYYYLKNKDLEFLSDETNGDKLKKDLLAVVNQYMGAGRFETVLFEQYLVK